MHVNCPSHFALHYSILSLQLRLNPIPIRETTPEISIDFVSLFISSSESFKLCLGFWLKNNSCLNLSICLHSNSNSLAFWELFTHLNWYFLDLSLNQLFCSLSRIVLEVYSFNVCQLILKRTTFVFWYLPLLLTWPDQDEG